MHIFHFRTNAINSAYLDNSIELDFSNSMLSIIFLRFLKNDENNVKIVIMRNN